ncbi:MAG: hypothetical protein CVU50_05530 [Candidatus Cloacimonetes bacterium HGW-Cloacimonetes-3]|jgi:hypothetical protein|nr:MAG: hypothetical protein CVU50_05530 [Candidatus Cloacimonetes bacterium HGW-Cloacimonetes-3]
MKVVSLLLILAVAVGVFSCNKQKEETPVVEQVEAKESESNSVFPYEKAKEFITNNGMHAEYFYPPVEFLGWKEVEKSKVTVTYQYAAKSGTLFSREIDFQLLNTETGPVWKFSDHNGASNYGL